MYCRVIPRDLFNEAKLLKCVGQLALLIHDGKVPGLKMEMLCPESDGFVIDQDNFNGNLFLSDAEFSFDGKAFIIGSRYNSKSPYPLEFSDTSDCPCVGDVFDDSGNLTIEFKEFLAKLR